MYIVFVFTKVVTAITLRMMKSVIQSGYKTFYCFLSITYSLEIIFLGNDRCLFFDQQNMVHSSNTTSLALSEENSIALTLA